MRSLTPTLVFILLGLLTRGISANAQNIGINTPTPNAALDVRSTGSTSATYGVLVSNNTNDTSLVVSDNGNVGIGTTLPAYTLDVQSSNPIAARFSGRVTGQNAVNANEFITLQQAGSLGSTGSYYQNPTMFSAPSPTSGTNFMGALTYCRNLTQGGFSDWRVPTVDEFIFMYQQDAIALPTLSNATYYWMNSNTTNPYQTSTGASTWKHVFYYTGNWGTSYFLELFNTYTTGTYSSFAICIR